MDKIKNFGKIVWDNIDFVLAIIFVIVIILNHVVGNYNYQYMTAWIGFWSCMILSEVRYIGRKVNKHMEDTRTIRVHVNESFKNNPSD